MDFIWEDDDTIVLIEAKVKIRPNSDPTFMSVHSMIASWSTECEAIEQARATAQELGFDKRIALIIATDEALAEQSTQFIRVAKYWNFLEGTGFDSVTVCSTAQVENVVRNSSPGKVFEKISETWEALDPLSLDAQIHDYDFFNPSDDEANQTHIEQGWEAVIPGFSSLRSRKKKPI